MYKIKIEKRNWDEKKRESHNVGRSVKTHARVTFRKQRENKGLKLKTFYVLYGMGGFLMILTPHGGACVSTDCRDVCCWLIRWVFVWYDANLRCAISETVIVKVNCFVSSKIGC